MDLVKKMDNDQNLLENLKCPECGGDIIEEPRSDIPDDYTMVAICKECGATFD
jgi:predicted Zn-ribbon and HTH transcriptional regulator